MVERRGKSPSSTRRIFAVAVSPDGGSIAFWSQDENNTRVLRTCALPACDAPKVLAAPPSQRRLRYTPDGRALAFLDSTMTNIWLLPLAGGPPRQLTRLCRRPDDRRLRLVARRQATRRHALHGRQRHRPVQGLAAIKQAEV